MKVILQEPGLEGSYVVSERHPDGTVVLRPETIDDVVAQYANRPLDEAEQQRAFERAARAAS